jgi:hypothetical protein
MMSREGRFETSGENKQNRKRMLKYRIEGNTRAKKNVYTMRYTSGVSHGMLSTKHSWKRTLAFSHRKSEETHKKENRKSMLPLKAKVEGTMSRSNSNECKVTDVPNQ